MPADTAVAHPTAAMQPANTSSTITSQPTVSRVTHNPLLVKHAVGKTRPTVYDLPGSDHVYGKRIDRDPLENAATVVQHWNVKATSKHAIPALDYITMNRNSAKQGIIHPTDIREYRKSHPVRVKMGDHTLYGSKRANVEGGLQRTRGPLPSDSNANFTYGKPTRPSTPVARLMTDQYQREWLNQLTKKQAEQYQLEKEKAAKKKNNKTAVPRQHSPPKPKTPLDTDPKTLFKMSKFQKVPAKIVSHRPEDDPAMKGIISSMPAKASPSAPKKTNQTKPKSRAGASTDAAAVAAEPQQQAASTNADKPAPSQPQPKAVSFS